MLDFYHKLAKRLHRLRYLVWLLATASVIAFTGVLFLSSGDSDESYLMLSVTLLLWTLSLALLTHVFLEPAPPVNPKARFVERTVTWFKRGVLWIVAALMTGLGGWLIVVSLKAFSVATRG